MKYKNILILTDNGIQYNALRQMIDGMQALDVNFYFRKSPLKTTEQTLYLEHTQELEVLDVKKDWQSLLGKFDLIISLHCKQFFPAGLVKSIKCINVHPGFNPVNRGWYPQVFAIIEDTIIGATIHEMDEKLDHGPIIAQEKTFINSWDTSLEVYQRILELEIKLLSENLVPILKGEYIPQRMESEGILRTKADFNAICELDLDEVGEFKIFLNKLRALSHGEYKNAFFIDPVSGKKVYVKIDLEPK